MLDCNSNVRSVDYEQFVSQPRPGHSDFSAHIKFKSFNDYRGGGHFSGRLTLPIVAARVIAKKILKGIQIHSDNRSRRIKRTLNAQFN